MRRRLLWSTIAVIAAVLVAFAVPLGLAVRSLLTTRALDALVGEAQPIAAFIDERARTCNEVQLVLALSPETTAGLSLFDRDGDLLLAQQGLQPVAGDELAAAARDRIGRARLPGHLAAAVPLSTRACGASLVLHAQRPDDALVASVQRTWLGIGAVGLTVLAVGGGAAWLLGRRLSEPFEELAGTARRLGEGDFTARAPRSGVEEADAIAAALDATADRLGRAIARGRAFTADASHQLRTPLTALRLHLETLAAGAGPDVDDDVLAAALAEADRLEMTVDELVALTQLDEPAQDVDVGALVAERVDAWRSLLEQAGRRVRVERLPAPRVRVRPAAVGQALQVLLDNARQHGSGTVTVRVEPTLPDGSQPDRGVRVVVADEGPGIPVEVADAPRSGRDRGGGPLPLSGGRGLGLARSLIEAEGGRLVLDATAEGGRAAIVLPATA